MSTVIDYKIIRRRLHVTSDEGTVFVVTVKSEDFNTRICKAFTGEGPSEEIAIRKAVFAAVDFFLDRAQTDNVDGDLDVPGPAISG